MRNPESSNAQPTRPERSGAGVLTVLVLLLLMGGVDQRSAAAVSQAARALVVEIAVADEASSFAVESAPIASVPETAVRLSTTRAPLVVRTGPDGWWPAPRAPDRDQVV